MPVSHEHLEEGALLLREIVAVESQQLLEEVARVAEVAPFRHPVASTFRAPFGTW
jgi:hypothetical protein